MNIKASKCTEETDTRALSLDGKTLKVRWKENEAVEVIEAGTGNRLGTLYAKASDTGETTLSGSLETAPGEGNDIYLYLHNVVENYESQTGVLLDADGDNSIESYYDYAYVRVASDKITVDEPAKTIAVSGSANFTSEQAIIKFILVDEEGNPINAKSLTLRAYSSKVPEANKIVLERTFSYERRGPLEVTPSTATNVLYISFRMAINVTENDMLSMRAVASNDEGGEDIYGYEKAGFSVTHGKYYEITVKMKKKTIDLSKLTADYTAQDGDILYGKLSLKYKILVAPGATVTLRDVEFATGDRPNAGISCEGDAKLLLEGKNLVYGAPGIYVAKEGTLTIDGDGSLDVSVDRSDRQTAAIGSAWGNACGNIEIAGGVITANTYSNGAAIGCGRAGTCGDITISGGTVKAINNSENATVLAAGIGTGSGDSFCGNITISGGNVTAQRSSYGYCSIGPGNINTVEDDTSKDPCGTITIGGVVYYSNKTFADDNKKDELNARTFSYPAS